jgi:hypothetical protein
MESDLIKVEGLSMRTVKIQTVKIRVSVEGCRYIGYVDIPEGLDRISDLLNTKRPFLKIQNPSSHESIKKDSDFIINKDHIDYVQVLEEPAMPEANKVPGTFYKIRVRTLSIEITGLLFVPLSGEEPMDIVNDERLFLSIKDAEIVDTPEEYFYLGISKRKICSVEVYQAQP